jgi:hypothetical protein
MITSVVLSMNVPHLSASADAVLAYNRSHHAELLAAGFLAFAAAAPLAIWTATSYRRLRALGVTAPGAAIALVGGVLAAASLALSGLLTWTSAHLHSPGDAAVARAVADLSFSTGAAGFVVPIALLLAGVAAPSLILGFGPRPWAWLGLVVAGFGLLSTFTLLTDALDFTLPIGRFGSVIWMIGVSVTLPRRRPDRRAAELAAPDLALGSLTQPRPAARPT